MSAGRVTELHRYPVKSLLGERLDLAEVDGRGLRGDRLFAVVDPDGRLGSGKTSRRFRRMDGLLALRAHYDGDVPVLTMPDGSLLRGDDDAVHAALSAHVGRSVRLAAEGEVPHFDDGPVHLVTTASLDALGTARGAPVDVRRMRPNLLVDTGDLTGFVEDGWIGRTLAVGGQLRLRAVMAMPRCVMTTMASADLPRDAGLLGAVTEHHDGDLGVLLEVVRPGTVRVGDPVEVLDR